MTNKEKIEWHERKLENVLFLIETYKLQEDIHRREIDRLYDIENKNVKS